MAAVVAISVLIYLSIGVVLGAVLMRSRRPRRAAPVGRVLRFAPMWGYWAFTGGPLLWRQVKAIHRLPSPTGSEAWNTEFRQANQGFMAEVLALHLRRCPICKVGREECEAAATMRRFIAAPPLKGTIRGQ
jgi:hypothetical protein